jgi:PPK2 family polyphosphate:nucleotide phosphotransferase
VDKSDMPVSGALERYRVKPGNRVDLSKIDSGEKSLFDGANKLEFEPQFKELQDQLQKLQKILYSQNKHRILVVMQAMDTGGKDGCIKHVFSHIDPQGIHVRSFKKPSEEELSYDFLWRVHSKVPHRGQLVIFNRSHYEDIIAVRVKKLFPDEVWQRRQRHVVDFERMLAEEGTTIVKIFLHISKDEQKRRLEERLKNPEKHWKFNPDDLADRARWNDFMTAYEDVIASTSTECAPWYIVPADRKWYRNLCVARIMLDTLKRLEMKLPAIDWNPKSITIED